MMYYKFFIIILFVVFSLNAKSFPIPNNDKAKFDIVRKNKVIGSHEINFIKNDDQILVKTNIDIKVKVLFIPAYKFSHKSTETWLNGNFVSIDAYTDFEDEREYFIKGKDEENNFVATGMDGKLLLDKNILPSNFWNINILKEKELFDTQKGITRTIEVKELGMEIIEINDKKIECKKFTMDASTNPKDKGPFPKYTLWYSKDNELMKFQFKNWKDKKIITIIRNDLD